MLRIIATLVIASIIGFALGKAQAMFGIARTPEHFHLPEHSVSVAAASIPSEDPTGVPKVELPNGYKFDFGQMQHGSSMSHSFLVRNVGDGPLYLEKSGSTCKCTVGNLIESVLKPGEETSVTLTWRAQTVAARFGQSATFKTNDPSKSELQFMIEGSVIDSFVFEPSQIDLGDFAPDEPITREFMVYCYSDDDVELERLNWSNPNSRDYVKLEFEEVPSNPEGKHPKASKTYRAGLEIQPGMPVGLIASKISFVTNHGDEIDLLELDVNGRVVSEIAIIGGSHFIEDKNVLNIGTLSPEESFSTTIWIKLSGQQQEGFELSIDQVDAKDSLLVKVGESKLVGKSKMIPIHFDVPKGAPEAYYPGNERDKFAKVFIRSNSTKLPELPIRVKLVVGR